MAVALEHEANYLGTSHSILEQRRRETESNRNYLYRILKNVGMTPILSQAGYYLAANWTTIGDKVALDNEKNECEDYEFTRWLIKNIKVFGLPTSSFYSDLNECSGKDILRFSIIKVR